MCDLVTGKPHDPGLVLFFSISSPTSVSSGLSKRPSWWKRRSDVKLHAEMLPIVRTNSSKLGVRVPNLVKNRKTYSVFPFTYAALTQLPYGLGGLRVLMRP
ncbi:hypothetical protein ECG_03868 [Echinococcus granulosus]|nr:hypothetical protein ECG_03868 [Echinococcus granulosus]